MPEDGVLSPRRACFSGMSRAVQMLWHKRRKSCDDLLVDGVAIGASDDVGSALQGEGVRLRSSAAVAGLDDQAAPARSLM